MHLLIVGLGNIGSEYAHTRHNIGFDIIDYLAKQKQCVFSLERHAYYAYFSYKGNTFHLLKPTTYMNLSGKAVRYWMQQLKIEADKVLVILDDKDLPFGKIRIRAKGSDGTHNGLRSITELLGHSNYPRLRFGIGNNYPKGRQVDFVLGKWSQEEAPELPLLIDKSAEAALNFGTISLDRLMNLYN